MQAQRFVGDWEPGEDTAHVTLDGAVRFRLRRCLGSGGMGVVYEAWDVERGTTVALKTLRTLDPQSLYRFKNEFRSLADLEHDHLVRLGELYFEGGRWFFTMELLDGTDLLSWVRPDDQLDESRLRSALRQLALGVHALHGAGKVHRDIKPSNVLVTREGRAVLLDFGLVSDLEGGRASTEGFAIGTAGYMAPEQACAAGVGPEADWYAVGVVLYEAMTGRLPFDGAPLEVLLDKQRYEPTAPRWIVADVPADLDVLCMDLLRTLPSARPSGQEILARLGLGPPLAASSRAPLTPPAHRAPYVGRGDEIAALRQAYDDSRRRRAVTMFVRGESGVGKSSLVRQFLATLPDPDVLVLSGRCYERESLPYKAFDGVVDSLSQHLARLRPRQAAALIPEHSVALARLFPVLRRVGALARVFSPVIEAEDPQELRSMAFDALRGLILRLSEHRPIVIFIDDFQWADADSLALLADLMHPAHAPPIFLVATMRPTYEPLAPGTDLSAVAAHLGEVRELPLGCLSPDDGRALATLLIERAIGEHPAHEAADIAEEAGGHPMFIQELVRHLAAVGSRARGIVRLEEALRHRVARLDPLARKLLEIVAVGGTPLPQLLAARAAGVAPSELGKLVSILRVAHLARAGGTRGSDRIEPYHDRVREAVIAGMDPQERRRLHGALAQALEEAGPTGPELLLLVRHLEAAGLAQRAARHALRAARFAREALAFDQGAELLRTALRLGDPADPGRRALQQALADALAEAGRGADAAELYVLASDGADSATRLECRRRAAEQLLLSGHIDSGVAMLQAVLGEVGAPLAPTPRRALVSLLSRQAFLRLRGFGWKPRDASEIPLADLERLEVYGTAAVGFALVDPIRAAEFQSRALLLALRIGEKRRVARMIAQEALSRSVSGPSAFDSASALLERSRRIAAECGDRYLTAFGEGIGGMALYLSGRFPEAWQRLREMEVSYTDPTGRDDFRTFSAWEIDTARLFGLFALLKLGRLRELEERMMRYRLGAARRGDRYGETSYLRGFNLVWLVKDRPAEAQRDLERATWSPPDGGYHVQHWYELRARVELAQYRADARGLLARHEHDFDGMRRSLLPRVMMLRAELLWLRGRAALTTAEAAPPSERARLEAVAARSARQLEREGVPCASAWAALLRAGLAARHGDDARTIAALEQAIVHGDSVQMSLVAAVAHRRRGALIGGDAGAAEIARAGATLRTEGVAAPERISDVVAPGFGRRP